MRPLPELNLSSGWFWKSGEDGVLRIQGCEDCDALVHPPVPVCPGCRSTRVVPKPVSGRATVVGLTVNMQQWLPDMAPPYVIANVALADDPTVHLTTNIVDCDPASVAIGQVVQVRFEHLEDVWIPLFAPTGETDPVERVPEPVRPTPRPAPTPERFEHKSVITGIGRSAIGRRLMRDPLSLCVDACLAAMADAGLSLEDIDGLSTYPAMNLAGMGEGGCTAVEEALRVHPTWINGGGDLPGPGGAVIQAMLAVAAGLCRHVLVFRTVWEATYRALGQVPPGYGGRASGLYEWRAPFGAMSPAGWIGMNASQYMHRYGATRELFGRIALNGRAGAARNPSAIYRDPLTMDDYLGARMISTPFGLYDCDVPCDASIALVVSAADVAADLPSKPVRIEAVGTQITERVSWDQDTITHEPQVIGQSAHLWSRTSLTPADVDVALLYDGFSFNAVSWLEGLGFCGFGEAQDFVGDGTRIGLGGSLPVNPHGGQLSEGRTHGFGFLYEAVTQLRGDAGERQVTDARTAVVTSGGGTPSGVLLLQQGG